MLTLLLLLAKEVDQECGEELGIIFSESRGVPLTQASDASGAAEQDIAEGDKAGGRPRRGEDVSEHNCPAD